MLHTASIYHCAVYMSLDPYRKPPEGCTINIYHDVQEAVVQ